MSSHRSPAGAPAPGRQPPESVARPEGARMASAADVVPLSPIERYGLMARIRAYSQDPASRRSLGLAIAINALALFGLNFVGIGSLGFASPFEAGSPDQFRVVFVPPQKQASVVFEPERRLRPPRKLHRRSERPHWRPRPVEPHFHPVARLSPPVIPVPASGSSHGAAANIHNPEGAAGGRPSVADELQSVQQAFLKVAEAEHQARFQAGMEHPARPNQLAMLPTGDTGARGVLTMAGPKPRPQVQKSSASGHASRLKARHTARTGGSIQPTHGPMTGAGLTALPAGIPTGLASPSSGSGAGLRKAAHPATSMAQATTPDYDPVFQVPVPSSLEGGGSRPEQGLEPLGLPHGDNVAAGQGGNPGPGSYGAEDKPLAARRARLADLPAGPAVHPATAGNPEPEASLAGYGKRRGPAFISAGAAPIQITFIGDESPGGEGRGGADSGRAGSPFSPRGRPRGGGTGGLRGAGVGSIGSGGEGYGPGSGTSGSGNGGADRPSTSPSIAQLDTHDTLPDPVFEPVQVPAPVQPRSSDTRYRYLSRAGPHSVSPERQVGTLDVRRVPEPTRPETFWESTVLPIRDDPLGGVGDGAGIDATLAGQCDLPLSALRDAYNTRSREIAQIVAQINARTKLRVHFGGRAVDPASATDMPLLIFSGQGAFSLNLAQEEEIRQFVGHGGMLWEDSSSPEFEQGFRREMTRLFGNPAPVPSGHPIYNSVFLLQSAPAGPGGQKEQFIAIPNADRPDRLAVLMTPNHYLDALTSRYRRDKKARASAVKIGINIVLFAADQFESQREMG